MNDQTLRIEDSPSLLNERSALQRNQPADLYADDDERSSAATKDEHSAESRATTSWPAHHTSDRTLADRAYAAIHGAIVDGTFAPGHRLRIEDLSATLRISPTPIREALGRLEAAGLAEHVPHRGSRVSEVSAIELRELYELRLLLEPLAIAKAAESFSPEAASAAAKHLEQLRVALRSDALPSAWNAHTAFHFTLYQAAQSRWLDRLITPLWDSCRRYRVQQNNLLANPAQNEEEHAKILQACVERDPHRASIELYNHTARNANIVSQATFGRQFFELKTA